MRGVSLLLLSMVCCAGCTAASLQRDTLQQIASITDLRYREVMNNLAIVAANPDVLPSLSVVADGTAAIADTVSVESKTYWQRAMFKGFDWETITPSFTRSPQPYWSLEPMVDFERLAGSWYALRWALGYPPEPGSPGDDWLKYFQIDRSLAQLPPCWLHVGGCKDVPVKAAYKAHCGATWVWVNSDGMAGLSALTLVVLDIGTVDLTSLGELRPSYQGPNAKVKVTISANGKAEKTNDAASKNAGVIRVITGIISLIAGNKPNNTGDMDPSSKKQSIEQDKQEARQIAGDASKRIWVRLKCWPPGVAPPVYVQFSPLDLNPPVLVPTAPPFPEGEPSLRSSRASMRFNP